MTNQDKVKNWLENKSISQTKLSYLLGENKQYVSYHLKKAKDMTLDVYERMRKVLDIAEDEIVSDNPVTKEKEVEYGGLSLIKQIKLLEERNQAINIEFEKVKAQIIQLKKDCGHKEGCLVKNIKLENEVGV